MFNHTPHEYKNPYAVILKDEGYEAIYTNREDVFYRDQILTAFISSKQWPNNPGNAIIIPNQSFENLYDIPDDILGKIHIFSKRLAIAMKETYGCDGVSIRQHNEPAGGQDVWHYHLHVFPRYVDDHLYQLHEKGALSEPSVRVAYAEKLRTYFI